MEIHSKAKANRFKCCKRCSVSLKSHEQGGEGGKPGVGLVDTTREGGKVRNPFFFPLLHRGTFGTTISLNWVGVLKLRSRPLELSYSPSPSIQWRSHGKKNKQWGTYSLRLTHIERGETFGGRTGD